MQADTSLLHAARCFDKEALGKIFELYSTPLYRYAIRITHDAVLADQIVGDVFAKLLDQLEAGNGPTTNLRSYLFETAYHLLVSEIRYSQRRTSVDDLDLPESDGKSPYLQAENRMAFEILSKSIQSRLTDYQRQVIILRFWEGFSLCETAKILGKSVNVIKAAQNRAVENLRMVINSQII